MIFQFLILLCFKMLHLFIMNWLTIISPCTINNCCNGWQEWKICTIIISPCTIISLENLNFLGNFLNYFCLRLLIFFLSVLLRLMWKLIITYLFDFSICIIQFHLYLINSIGLFPYYVTLVFVFFPPVKSGRALPWSEKKKKMLKYRPP